MKKVELTAYTHAEIAAKDAPFGFLKIAINGALIRAEGDELQVSDGYHTFDELYDHRITLWIILCKYLKEKAAPIYRAKLHQDGTSFDGWFILGLDEIPGKQITYHLPLARWEECDFAETRERAPEWDGHTPQDTIERLKAL